jgi:hypothetical protein
MNILDVLLDMPLEVINLDNCEENVFLFDIKRTQDSFLQEFDINKHTSKLYVRDKNLYIDILPDLIEEQIKTENRHEDLANYRRYYEFLNIKLIKDRVDEFILIDVGASTRLVNSCIARVALAPKLGVQDYLRGAKIKENIYTKVMDLTLEQFIEKYKKHKNFKKIIYNFTDSIYYIPDTVLLELAEDHDEGIVAVGTMHIFKNRFVSEKIVNDLGIVILTKDKVSMKVLDNESTYYHINKWVILEKYDNYTLFSKNFNLNVIVERRKELNASTYIRFVIIKSQMKQFSPNLNNILKKEVVINTAKDENEERLKAQLEQTVLQELMKSKCLTGEKVYVTDELISVLMSHHNGSVPFPRFKELMDEVILDNLMKV